MDVPISFMFHHISQNYDPLSHITLPHLFITKRLSLQYLRELRKRSAKTICTFLLRSSSPQSFVLPRWTSDVNAVVEAHMIHRCKDFLYTVFRYLQEVRDVAALILIAASFCFTSYSLAKTSGFRELLGVFIFWSIFT